MRPIDADALESIIQEQVGKCVIKVFNPSVNLILQDIRNTPTIEAEPVKHGWWERRMTKIYACSECTNEVTDRQRKNYSFCPYCGARMDGDSDDKS